MLEAESDNSVAVTMILVKFKVFVSCKAVVGRICKLISEFEQCCAMCIVRGILR